MTALLTHPKYRPDIDGLRAFAIIAVVIYHGFPTILTGGFVGVDVFFVISGFLISTIIFENLGQGSFSFKTFYARRIRRIFPALLLILFCSFIYGWIVILPDQYERFCHHIMAGAAFVFNFDVAKKVGYFDDNMAIYPLLHLWSLSIEEQFYIIWPFLVWLAFKTKFNLLLLVIIAALLSFVSNIALSYINPIYDFYMPYTRFWELLIGSGLAYVNLFKQHWQQVMGKIINANIRSIIGLLLLIISVCFISKDNLFPGWWALLPVFATMLLISAGGSLINRTLLSSPLAVWIGIISYPLYLWHYPLLAFGRIINGGSILTEITIIICLVAILLSYLTYRFIERPIRRQKNSRKTIIVLIAAMIAMFIISMLAALGVIGRYDKMNALAKSVEEARHTYFTNTKPYKFEDMNFHIIPKGKNITLMVGDSHVEQYIPRVTDVVARPGSDDNTVIFATSPGCYVIPNTVTGDEDYSDSCDKFTKAVQKLVQQDNVDKIIIGHGWNLHFTEHPVNNKVYPLGYYILNGAPISLVEAKARDLAFDSLEKMLIDLSKTKKTYLLLDNPSGDMFNPKTYISRDWLGFVNSSKLIKTISINPEQIALNNKLIAIAKSAGVEVINPTAALCADNQCRLMTDDGKFIYRDTNHLTYYFTRDFASYIDWIFQAVNYK